MKKILLTGMILATMCVVSAADAKQKHCPPGLAKKSVPCVPPGQVYSRGHAYEPGYWIGDDDYHMVTYPDRYGLPYLPRGQRYVIIGNQIMIVSEDTYEVMALIGAVANILD